MLPVHTLSERLCCLKAALTHDRTINHTALSLCSIVLNLDIYSGFDLLYQYPQLQVLNKLLISEYTSHRWLIYCVDYSSVSALSIGFILIITVIPNALCL